MKDLYDDFKDRIHMSYPKLFHERNGKKNCNDHIY